MGLCRVWYNLLFMGLPYLWSHRTQYSGVRKLRSGRVVRTDPDAGLPLRTGVYADSDRTATAQRHFENSLLAKVLMAWHKHAAATRTSSANNSGRPLASTSASPAFRRLSAANRTSLHSLAHTNKPGMTGLRNLGQTCYMNAVLQAYAHVDIIRRLLYELVLSGAFASVGATSGTSPSVATRPIHKIERQPTVQVHELMEAPQVSLQSHRRNARKKPKVDADTTDLDKPFVYLIESLFRVLWSGRWVLVTPNWLLATVWKRVPQFQGFMQQDAHEFLMTLDERIMTELEQRRLSRRLSQPHFESTGTPTSRVSAERTGSNAGARRVGLTRGEAGVESVLPAGSTEASPRRARATAEDGTPHTPAMRTSQSVTGLGSTMAAVTTTRNAQKYTRLISAPQVLKIHLKRFRWQQTDRCKLQYHVACPLVLDLSPYLAADHEGTPKPIASRGTALYDLMAMVVHEGSSLTAGHYKALVYNPTIGAWVVKNDARVSVTTAEDVLERQAYILFYVQRQANKSARYDLSNVPPTPAPKLG
ncbi:uncharacterized protein MONBRDRAFT_9758 [Monosiga brevicollis MX1]|uniref:Ubiquitin carboxyl-terminal hydrolase n=1 Tax=Monosiga brevicollis TaxID=81824 RepID=A9V453_MONBE|nr:uncharacterized protein MONBRDRAFT_9758 [Monosiga brevicollis MX1]EDQ87646.1 predicted protein [Monosiga brevicollis MX1]|eukprot:XP_001747566.1 hypothetical protein [Monosiga brevicollis MX1]